MNELISIIVPIYKVEKYLNRCVDSILNQTYRNLEIILVNDGSPDRSGEICDEYSTIDGRVKVIYKENGGVSAARNLYNKKRGIRAFKSWGLGASVRKIYEDQFTCYKIIYENQGNGLS